MEGATRFVDHDTIASAEDFGGALRATRKESRALPTPNGIAWIIVNAPGLSSAVASLSRLQHFGVND